MTKQQKEREDNLRRKAFHRMLDLALDINEMQVSQRMFTEDHPTALFYMHGHTGNVDAIVYPHGWALPGDPGADERTCMRTRMDGETPYGDECAPSEAVRRLEEIKAELIRERENALTAGKQSQGEIQTTQAYYRAKSEECQMDKVDKAVETIKGYCEKFVNCKKGCRFYDAEADMCAFQDSIPPAEWEIRDGEEH